MNNKIVYIIFFILAISSGYYYVSRETESQDNIKNGLPYLNWTLQEPPMQNIQASDVYHRANPFYYFFSVFCLTTPIIHLVATKEDTKSG